jgi:hypothetical protein
LQIVVYNLDCKILELKEYGNIWSELDLDCRAGTYSDFSAISIWNQIFYILKIQGGSHNSV